VAIKLIRKESVDNSTRLSKVEREISVLRVSYPVFFFHTTHGAFPAFRELLFPPLYFFVLLSRCKLTYLKRWLPKTVRHPYIVKLYDVLETEKYIGIILECASGELVFLSSAQ
jgi:serine/threonine protein kinase